MSSFLDKLNLRPQERRLVVGAAAVLFVILQFWIVRPYFAQWGQVNRAMERARATHETYRKELARTNEYQVRLAELEGQGGSILAADQAQPNILIAQVQNQAAQSRVNLANITAVAKSATSRTNQFFEEQTLSLGVNPTGDDELIDFLLAMGTSDLKIRIRELDLSPDPSQTKLKGSMRLVASFQKPTAGVPRASPVPGLASKQP